MSLPRRLAIAYWSQLAQLSFFRSSVSRPRGFVAKGPISLRRVGSGQMVLGDNMTLVGSSQFNRVGVNHPPQVVVCDNATLRIGNEFKMTGGTIFCAEEITIGEHVMFGANSKVFDTDFHPIDWRQRRENGPAETAPVHIGDDVWLCTNVTVLKGVTIGARSVIAAGSVVTRDIPADCLAGGTPAKPIRNLSS